MANPSLQIGNGKFAIKENDLLGYSSSGTRFFPIPITMTRATLGTRVNPSGLIENVELSGTVTNLARVDYTDGTGSLLVEPQRTNLFTYSEDFSQFPISNRLVITPNNITSPDGTINASKMQQTDGVTTAPNIAFSNVSAGTYTVSAFAKKGTRSFLVISFNGTSYFDLQNGTITTTGSGHTASIENFGNDWYRCSIVKTISTTQTAAFYFADTNNTLTTADDEGYMYLYGTQLEQGSYPTSYIKTQGSTVTRNKDEYTKTGISDKINSEEGVLFLEMAALSDDLTFRSISLNDGTNTNSVGIRYRTDSNRINAIIKDDNGVTFQMNFDVSDITQFNKIALKYKSGDNRLYINGTEVSTNSSTFSFTSALNDASFNRGDGNDDFYGKVKQLQVYKTALSDSELATLTT